MPEVKHPEMLTRNVHQKKTRRPGLTSLRIGPIRSTCCTITIRDPSRQEDLYFTVFYINILIFLLSVQRSQLRSSERTKTKVWTGKKTRRPTRASLLYIQEHTAGHSHHTYIKISNSTSWIPTYIPTYPS